MAKKNNFLGLAKLEIGLPGDGVMGDDLTSFEDAELDGTSIEGRTSTLANISTYKKRNYLTVNGESTPSTVTIRLYGVTPEQRAMLEGGTVDSEGLYAEPVDENQNIYRSVNMEGEEIDGVKYVIRMPYAHVQSRLQGTISNTGLPALELTLTANTPESEDGVKGSAMLSGPLTVAPEV